MAIFLPKNLVSSQKSSTFAAVFAPTAGEQRNRAKIIKKCNAENQPLTKKITKNAKKMLKNLVSPKKSSTFAPDFALSEKTSAKSK